MEDKFYIRPMDFEDVEEVSLLDYICFPDPWSIDTYVYEVTKNHLASYVVIVDKEREKIAGYSGMWVVLGEAQITNIAVLPEYRGLGLGRALMKRQIRDSLVAGANKMTLEARVSNHVAIGLYEKLGFVHTGIRKGYYENDKEDAVIMWKYYEEELGLTWPEF